jgi:hypothetical protein
MENEISKNLDDIFARKRAAVVALSLEYSGRILEEFRIRQRMDSGMSGEYWDNQTAAAARSVFSDAIIEDDEIGFFIAHLMEYGVYLEMANDRQNEALRPLIEEFYPQFRADLAEIYGEAA